jgi:hypoxanthine phosphoribosyltransferase
MTEAYVEVVTEDDLRRRVEQLGAEIAADYEGREPVLLGVLMGCLPFLADLVRAMPDTALEVDMLSLARFGSEGRAAILLDASIPLAGRDVIIVEDIVDTGLTLRALRRSIEMREVASLATVALLDKAPRRIVDVPLEYRGFEVGDEFLLGYGLDWEGRFRNLRSLWAVLDLGLLARDPGSFEELVFGARLAG